MWSSPERDLKIPPKKEHLAPNDKHQEVVEQPQMEKQRGGRVETSTQIETSSRGSV